MRSWFPLAYAAGALLILSACTATQSAAATDPAAPSDFLFGCWHGFIAPITFLVSIFSETVRVYAVPNTGLGYDFGFMLGISGFSGGIFSGSRRRAKQAEPKQKHKNVV
jgi:hypothetical protein